VPGRIRLRLGPEIWDWAKRQELGTGDIDALLAAVGGFAQVRLNPAAASLVIEYDPRRLDPSWWETLISGEDDEAVALVLGILAAG
jgi:hypothetical protein